MRNLIVLALLCLIPLSATAQSDPYSFSEDAGDHEAVMSVIKDFFVAFAARDSTGMAEHVDLDSRLMITGSDTTGAPSITPIPMDRFLGLIANRQGEPIEETIWGETVHVMDNLASVWVNYNLWVGEVIDHCGKDNFQLARTSAGWKIIAVADTQRREGCVPVVRN